MNIIVLLAGFFIIGIIELNIWIGKYIFVDKVERNYKEKGKRGTFKVESISYGSDNGDTTIQREHPTGRLYDEYGNCLEPNYMISNCNANVGEIINVEYYETNNKFWKYNARPFGYKEPRKLMNGLIVFFLILGLAITIPISIFI